MDLVRKTVSRAGLRILTVNDVYSMGPLSGLGGWAELSSMVEKYRTPNSLFILNGDFLGGNSTAAKFKGSNIIEILNTLKFDYVVTGNHEFDYGDDILKGCISQSNFGWLGSNIFEKSTGTLFEGLLEYKLLTIDCSDELLQTNTMTPAASSSATATATANGSSSSSSSSPVTPKHKEKDGGAKTKADQITVGIFGVCTQATPHLSYPSKNVEFRSPLEVSRRLVKMLRNDLHADVVLAVNHLAFEDDKKIAGRVGGIDVIFGGHDHSPMLFTEESTWIFKTGQNAYHLGVVDLEFEVLKSHKEETLTNRHVHVFPSFQLVANRGLPPDPKCLSVINKYQEIIERDARENGLNKVVLTVLPSALRDLSTLTDNVRRRESAFGCFIADGMRDHFVSLGHPCDMAFINGGYIRGDRTYAPGEQITLQGLKEELPFPMECVLIRLKGEDLKQAIEQQLRRAPRPVGSFPHPSEGFVLTFNSSLDPDSKVVSLTLNGKPLDPSRTYDIAITNFMASGGDECSSFKKHELISSYDCLFDLIGKYCEKTGTINTEPLNRVINLDAV